MMKNAFDPQEETERDWDIELCDDVKGEVESKYGPVVDIFVVKESQVSCHSRAARYAVAQACASPA